MLPNTNLTSPYDKPQNIPLPVVQSQPKVNENYGWHICQTTLNLIGRLSIGVVVGISVAFAFRNGVPLNALDLHIVLCVVGVSTFLFILNLFFSKMQLNNK